MKPKKKIKSIEELAKKQHGGKLSNLTQKKIDDIIKGLNKLVDDPSEADTEPDLPSIKLDDDND